MEGQKKIRAGLISVLIFLLAFLWIVAGIPAYLLDGGDSLLCAATYQFYHGNVAHLAGNMLVLWLLLARPKRLTVCKACSDLVLSYLLSVLIYPLAVMPIVGMSNMIYAMCGLRTPPLSNPIWRRWPALLFLGVTAAMLAVPGVSATTHLAAFALGALCAGLRRFWNRLTDEARRYYR